MKKKFFFWIFMMCLKVVVTVMRIRIQLCTFKRIRIQFYTLLRIRILLLINVMEIASTGLHVGTLQGYILSFQASIGSVYCSILDPDTDFHSTAGPDPDPASKYNAGMRIRTCYNCLNFIFDPRFAPSVKRFVPSRTPSSFPLRTPMPLL
jgi:hypothetical protein